MSNELSRLQVRKNTSFHDWGDVGHKTGDQTVPVDVISMPAITIDVGDISIGAVEIKDATTDTRATVGANGLYVDVQASALPSGASTEDKQDDIIDAIEGITFDTSSLATSDNQTNGDQITQIQETVPTDSTKNNSSTALSYDENGDLQYIDETIGAVTYRTTLTYDTRVLVGISEAVVL